MEQEEVVVIFFDEVKEFLLHVGASAHEEGDTQHEDGISHLDGILEVVDDQTAEEGGHPAAVQELLSLVDFLLLVVLDDPVLNFFLEDIAGPLDEIGEESDDKQFVLGFDAVGVHLVHFDDGFDDFGAVDYFQLVGFLEVVAGSGEGPELGEDVVELFMDLLLREGVEGLVDLDELDKFFPPLVYDDVVLVGRFEFLGFNVKAVGLGGGEIFGQGGLLFAAAVFFLGLCLLAVGVVIDFGLGLDPLVDVGETDDFEGVIPSAIVEGLFGFVGDGFYLFADVVEGLIPLDVESLEGVPIQEVPPEGFPVSESVLLPRRYVVWLDVIFLDISGLPGFAFIFIVLCHFEGDIFDKLLQSLADLVYVLVYVPAGDCFEQVLQVLDDF